MLGVLGCCFGLLGVFTLGLVFVPFAVLFSLLSLMAGLINRSTVGTIAGIGSLTLSAIGFFSSPSLMLAVSGLLVASQAGSSSKGVPPQVVSSVASVPDLPQQEQKFCEITSTASAKYFRLADDAKKARDDNNGILGKRAEDAMTATRRDRDRQILKVARENNFTFDDWGVQLLEIGTPTEKRVSFSVRPLCSDLVTIHLTAPADARLIEVLATKHPGDAFAISGTFAGAPLDTDDAPVVPDAKQFEASITERGSMEEPEYWAQLRQ